MFSKPQTQDLHCNQNTRKLSNNQREKQEINVQHLWKASLSRSSACSHGHIESVHENIRRFSCDLCSKKFTTWQNIEKHIKCCHVKQLLGLNIYDSSRPFKCEHPNCNKCFRTKRSLREHKRYHSGLLN